MSHLIRAMRPQHWVKNVFVLAPLVFAQQAGDPDNLARVAAAFGLFSLIASAVYLVNDIADREVDREHPRKKLRPIASGALSARTATVAALVLVAVGLGCGYVLTPELALVLALYLAVNVGYSAGLKRVVILDVMLLAAGFLLRVWAGAAAVDVVMSHWLLLCTGLISLFLGLVKRRQEIVTLDIAAPDQRPILREYSLPFIDQMISTVTAGTIVAYSLYAFSPEVALRLGTKWFGLTIPFVVFGIFRYLYLVHQRNEGDNPTALLMRDRAMLVNVGLWAAVVLLALYNGV